MAKLNAKNDTTKKIIHIVITEKCDRCCPDCCNNQYNMANIPVVSGQELREAEMVFLTGGEPFAYADPILTAMSLRSINPNLKIYVYTNAFELGQYLKKYNWRYEMFGHLYGLNGLTISIKEEKDRTAMEQIVNKHPEVLALESIRVYTFPGFEDTEVPAAWDKRMRYWQKDFIPASDSIFRRLTLRNDL